LSVVVARRAGKIIVIQLESTKAGEGLVARRALAFEQRGHAFARCC